MTDDELAQVLAARLKQRYTLPRDVELSVPTPAAPTRPALRGVAAAAASAVLVAAIGVGVAFGVHASPGDGHHRPAATGPTPARQTSAPPAIDAPTERRLWTVAVHAAQGWAGVAIQQAQAVRSTHDHAVRTTMDDVVSGSYPVWVVQIETVTSFECRYCSGPPGSSVHGRYILLVVDAATFQSDDTSISSHRTDLNRLGTVIDLHP